MEWGWAFDGVNQTIPRNAGPECTRYLSWQRQIIENVVVTSISIFVLHWIWKRLSPCFDPSEEHRAILEQRLHDSGGGQKGGVGGGGVKPNLQPPGGYFENTAPPPLILQRGNSVKSALLFNNSNSNSVNPSCPAGGGGSAAAAVCHSKGESGECRFNVNSGYCDNSGSVETAAAGGGEGSDTYQQQQQRFNDGELEYNGKALAVGIADKIFVGKQVLLVLMTFVLGLELGFKFASRTVIYLLNPCHITTIMQIYLLAAKPSKFATAIFRIQMNYMNGPILAFLFPETDSRKIAMEVILYWMQHGLMFINSIYLLRLKHKETGVSLYSVPPLFDFTWNIFSYAWLMVYHFAVLVSLAIPSEVNLNHMLCPAVLDPFNGPNYRLIAIVHQLILCPLMCKTICFAFAPQEQGQLRRRRKGLASGGRGPGGEILSNNIDTESSLLISSMSSLSGVASNSSSFASSPSIEHPIQSLNRTEYLNLIDDSEEEGHHEDLLQAPTLTPLKRCGQNVGGSVGLGTGGLIVSGAGGGGVTSGSQSEVVFSGSNALDKTFVGFLDRDKKQE